MRQIQLNFPYELREGLWGLNIGCTATLRADESLSLMRKLPGESEFTVFVPVVQNERELRRDESEDPDFPCIKEATYYFDIDLGGWDMTEIRCAVNANTEEEVLSDIGVFQVVPSKYYKIRIQPSIIHTLVYFNLFNFHAGTKI